MQEFYAAEEEIGLDVQKPLTWNGIVPTRKTRRKRTRKYMQESELVKGGLSTKKED
jgi:hypothetical protein